MTSSFLYGTFSANKRVCSYTDHFCSDLDHFCSFDNWLYDPIAENWQLTLLCYDKANTNIGIFCANILCDAKFWQKKILASFSYILWNFECNGACQNCKNCILSAIKLAKIARDLPKFYCQKFPSQKQKTNQLTSKMVL